MSIKAIIMDDESLARDRVRAFLKEDDEIEIIGEAENGLVGLEMIREYRPDLIFLDIQMPEMDGFTMLKELGSAERPCVIFTTAYDEYAIQAFEVEAIDYLLKPFSKARFYEALKRIKSQWSEKSEKQSLLEQKLERLLAGMSSEEREPELKRLTIRDQGRMYFIPLQNIHWIEAAGNYAEIHDGKKTHLLRETMTQLEGRLPSQEFMRVNRSAIVRIDSIVEIQSSGKGEHYIILKSGDKVKSTLPLKELQLKLM